VVDYEARGGTKEDFNKSQRDAMEGFEAVPGLLNAIHLSAWKRRREYPYIHVLGSPSDTEGSGIVVRLMPRTYWDVDPDFTNDGLHNEGHRDFFRQIFDDPSFDPEKHFVTAFSIASPVGQPTNTILRHTTFDVTQICRGAEIAEALTASTRAQDLADAIAWFEKYPFSEGKGRPQEIRNRSRDVHGAQMPEDSAPVPSRALNDEVAFAYMTMHNGRPRVREIRNQSRVVHGDQMPEDSVPAPSRALLNEVAYMILHDLDLECAVRLVGLRGAAHLNGREGVIRGADPANNERWRTRLDDGKYVSVRAVNFVHIHQGEYKRRSP